MQSNYSVTMVSGVPVMTAPDEIDASNAEGLRAAIFDTMAHGHAAFVVDMTATGCPVHRATATRSHPGVRGPAR